MAGQLHSLSERLDAIAEKVASLRLSGPRDLRSHKAVDNAFTELKRLITQSAAPADDRGVIAALQSLERRLETLDHPQPALVQTFDRVQAIEKKLDLIQRGPQELSQRLDQLNRLETLERKLDAMQGAPNEIAARLDEIRAALDGRSHESHHAAGVEAALGALAARVERLHQDRSEQEALRRLQAEVQAIGQKIDMAAGAGVGETDAAALERIRSIESKLDMLQDAPVELARRLDQIQHMMQAAPAPGGMPQGFETLLRNLALRLESIQSSPADDRTLDRLHQDIRQISERLEATPAAQQVHGLAEVGNLERSISELFGQLQQLRGEMGTTAEHAARRAADQVISLAPASREGGSDEMVRRQLSEIHAAQQEAERRSNETLGAVHETLTRVVDRLVDLEQDIKKQPRMAPPAAPAAAPLAAAPLQAQPLPPIGAPPASETAAPRGAGFPDGAPLSVAALRSQRLGVSAPTAAPEQKGGIGQILAAARDAVTSRKRGKDKAEDEAPPSEPQMQAPQVRPPAAPAPSAPDLSLDMPLEPGSGRPRPGQREAMAEGGDAKANFLAAARRAAQAAAEQSAEAMAQNSAAAKGSKKAAGPKKSLSKKQVILLGLAALVVAVGASIQVMQAPPKVEPQTDKLSNLDRLLGRQTTAAKSGEGNAGQSAPNQRRRRPPPWPSPLPRPSRARSCPSTPRCRPSRRTGWRAGCRARCSPRPPLRRLTLRLSAPSQRSPRGCRTRPPRGSRCPPFRTTRCYASRESPDWSG